MAFEGLTDKLQGAFKKLSGRGKLSEQDVRNAMREVRLALLEADVNFLVVKDFIKKVTERAVGQEILSSLTPGQQVIKIVNEELTQLMGGTNARLEFTGNPPTVIMLIGLQGAGKTTLAGKLAGMLTKQGKKPMLVAADVYRPAAIKQLQVVGSQVEVPVFEMGQGDPVQIVRAAKREAIRSLRDVMIVDTAGRLQIDEEMMQEAVAIKQAVKPDQILMVVDAMTGQDIVNVVTEFANRVDFDGVIMSKLDGDARGGGALSVREVTGKPIKFVSMGEKPDSLEVFHPDRMAKRILGMGDVYGIIEQAQQAATEEQAAAAERMLREGFTMDDMLAQLQQIRKMGGLQKIASMIPGMDRAMAQQPGANLDDSQLTRIEAIIHSMTKEERAKPKVINGQRRKRIAAGSGRSVQEVNQLIKQWGEMNKMMGKMRGMMSAGNSKKARRSMGNMMRNMGMGGRGW